MVSRIFKRRIYINTKCGAKNMSKKQKYCKVSDTDSKQILRQTVGGIMNRVFRGREIQHRLRALAALPQDGTWL